MPSTRARPSGSTSARMPPTLRRQPQSASTSSPPRCTTSLGHFRPTATSCPESSPCPGAPTDGRRSEEHTSELQSRGHLVCRLLLEKKKTLTQLIVPFI